MRVIGRQKEIQQLEELQTSAKAEFVAVYGRRRVGKTFLIREFFRDRGHYFELTGTNNAPLKQQLWNFSEELKDKFPGTVLTEAPTTWLEAFAALKQSIKELTADKRITIFIDELPWLATPRSGFLGALDHAWNRYFSKDPRIILIVCGSAAAWMIHHIIDEKGGLYGRLTAQLHLMPFSLTETEAFLKSKHINLDRKQIAEIYFALGGIPKYLEYLKQGLSASQNIQNICFSQGGALTTEFQKLYASLFGKCEHHISIIEALAKHRTGLPLNKLLDATALSSGGASTKIIRELITSNFISFIPDFGKKKKGGRYCLSDEFSMFYYTWMKNSPAQSISESTWLRKANSAAYNSWAGFTFEMLCYKHLKQIISALDLSIVAEGVSNWTYRPEKESEKTGEQIDLVITRADRCINLCEIKFHNDELAITPEYAHKLNRRREKFRGETKTRKSLFNTLITSYGVKHNENYLTAVDNQLTLDDLFEE